jgi:hypothetical protein
LDSELGGLSPLPFDDPPDESAELNDSIGCSPAPADWTTSTLNELALEEHLLAPRLGADAVVFGGEIIIPSALKFCECECEWECTPGKSIPIPTIGLECALPPLLDAPEFAYGWYPLLSIPGSFGLALRLTGGNSPLNELAVPGLECESECEW